MKKKQKEIKYKCEFDESELFWILQCLTRDMHKELDNLYEKDHICREWDSLGFLIKAEILNRVAGYLDMIAGGMIEDNNSLIPQDEKETKEENWKGT